MNFWFKIKENLFVIYQKELEDFRAVLGAKTSRSLNLEKKSFLSEEEKRLFLEKNLFGYNHASIGEMSFPSIFHRGFGWISSWILLDNPLFVGQEVSTRAVNLLKNFSRSYDSNIEHEENFQLFKKIFLILKKKIITKGYRYDYIRWSLPGSFSTGAILMMNSRILIRHLIRMKEIFFMKTVTTNYFLGAKVCSPYVFQSLYTKKKKEPYYRWLFIDLILNSCLNFDRIRISPSKDFSFKLLKKLLSQMGSRTTKKSYLKDEYNELGLFKIEIKSSIASARDFHRHRSFMPWKLKLILNNKNQPFISNYYNFSDFNLEVEEVMKNFKQKKILKKKIISFYDLYYLPLGTQVLLTGFAPLDKLVYMLELRSQSLGANFEYKDIAEKGLRILRTILGEDFCQKNLI